MSWWEQATGRSQAETDAYRANKDAMGGAIINQQNLDAAAAVGALGKDANGTIVRDASKAGDMDRYLDMIMGEAFGNDPSVQQAASGGQYRVDPNDPNRTIAVQAPVPQDDPRRRGLGAPPAEPGYTEEDIDKLETALSKGVSWESILGGALGGGVVLVAKAFMDNWNKNKANGPTASGPNAPEMGGAPQDPNRPRGSPLATQDNAMGASYLEWLTNPEVSGAKETVAPQFGNVVDGTFREVGTDPQITHQSAASALNDLRQQLLTQQSFRGDVVDTIPTDRQGQMNNTLDETFKTLKVDGSNVHDILTPTQVNAIVEATNASAAGEPEEKILQRFYDAGLDFNREAVVDAVRRVIAGQL
jgi:hypothetical protein